MILKSMFLKQNYIAKEAMFFNWYYRASFNKNLREMNLMFTERYGLLTLPHIYFILIMEVLN